VTSKWRVWLVANPAVTDEVEAEVQVLQDPLARVSTNIDKVLKSMVEVTIEIAILSL
jgi:hypothetical protein